MVKIFIDSGHGGKDSGAIGNGLYEKNIVLDLSKRVERLLKNYKNVEIMQSRTDDTFLELSERTNKANEWGADCFISLHINASVASYAKGFESFIWNGQVGSDTVAFQNVLHQEIINKIGAHVTDRGKKRANFHVIRESNMKACLTESLFISSSSDAKLLKDEMFLEKLAEGHVIGLEKFYGLERIRPPSPEMPNESELYQVIAGTFSNYENAENQVKKLESDGYKAYINKK